jgi:peptide/nickel transport system permease protein
MLSYILHRFFYMIILLLAVSLLSFVIINLPPGDYVDRLVFTYQIQQGIFLTEAEIAGLRHQFGLDRSLAFQYLNWFRDILTGDFGFSFEWGRPVKELIWERIGLTMVITVCSILFSFAIAVPIGLYSAARRYSVADYVATFIGFIGLAVPNFLLALILMWLGHLYFGTDIGGLFSREFLRVGWSWAKFVDMLGHLWVPVVVIGTAGTASTIRVMRSTTADELNKPYVMVARSKGLTEFKVIVKHTFRVAINPVISTIGWLLPAVVSGEAITAVVLGLPTTGTLLLQALLNQDMNLAGSFILILSSLTVIGTLLSDILLAFSDPRIRYE